MPRSLFSTSHDDMNTPKASSSRSNPPRPRAAPHKRSQSLSANLSSRRKNPDHHFDPSYSSTSWSQNLDPSTRPSVSAIAMGLHLSSTPYSRRRGGSPADELPQSSKAGLPHQRVASPLPPPPARSAMKKAPPSVPATQKTPSLTSASTSSSATVSSKAPSMPLVRSLSTTLKSRMARYVPLPARSTRSLNPSATSSVTDIAAPLPAATKAVRFHDS
ncbi:hypothetical protein DL96DRAFT_1811276 [Flagelloscypha sp. PMI_526]|nr:hypothetical protein DL96DRAFT_1811276 [Flagelloscypha sp. PMI_526]